MRKFFTTLQEKFQRMLSKKDFQSEIDRLPENLSKIEIYRLAYIKGFWEGTTETVSSLEEMNQ